MTQKWLSMNLKLCKFKLIDSIMVKTDLGKSTKAQVTWEWFNYAWKATNTTDCKGLKSLNKSQKWPLAKTEIIWKGQDKVWKTKWTKG